MVSSTPRPHFTTGKDPVPILQEAGWAPGPVWTGGNSLPRRDSIPDRPARSQALYLIIIIIIIGISFSKCVKVKTIPVQPWTGPKGSRRWRLPDFETVGTCGW